MILDNLKERWAKVEKTIAETIGGGEVPDVSTIVYLIGVQELGQNRTKFNKDQKLDLMHVGVCTILEPFGYYKYLGRDSDGWPHFETTEKLPHLSAGQQQLFLKEAIVMYFEEQWRDD